MDRRQLLPVLAIATIGLLVTGSLVCVLGGALVTGRLTNAESPPSRLGAPPSPPRMIATLTSMSPAVKPASSATPTPSGSANVAASTATSSTVPGPFATASPTATQAAHSTPGTPAGENITVESSAASPTTTPQPTTAAPTSTPQPSSPAPAQTTTPSPTPVIVTPRTRPPASVTGRVVKDGAPVEERTTVKLEDTSYAIIATTTTDAQGVYTFDNLTTLESGLNVLFAQEWNEQHDVGEVASWAWLGPFTVSGGTTMELPDFEISLLGFEQVNPPNGASLAASQISPQRPLIFEWAPYPEASVYWVDLMQGDSLAIVWRSHLVDTTSVAFDGTLDDGSSVTADRYWWGIGACANAADYQLTVYGYLPALEITP